MSCVPSLHQTTSPSITIACPAASAAALAVSSQAHLSLKPTPVPRLMRRFQPKCYKQMYTATFGTTPIAFNQSYHLYWLYLEGTLKTKIHHFPLFVGHIIPFVSSVCQQSAPHRATCVTHAVRCLQVVVPVDGHCGQNVIQLRHRGQSHGGGFCNQDRFHKN